MLLFFKVPNVNFIEDQCLLQLLSPRLCLAGVTATGVAALDPQGREAVVSVEASDEPFGMLSIAPSSRSVSTEEKNTTIRIYINREFGASGLSLRKHECKDVFCVKYIK